MTEKEDPAFVERFTVRMPDGMRDAVAARAKANGRSMNSEIVQILQDAIANEIDQRKLDGISFGHADTKGLFFFNKPGDIAKYIEQKTEEFKQQIIEDLQNFRLEDDDKKHNT